MICHLGLIGYFQGAMGPALAPPPPPYTYLGLLARSQVIGYNQWLQPIRTYSGQSGHTLFGHTKLMSILVRVSSQIGC